ncbi:MAG: PQQ-binding-like beta-propeller repeat protein [Planctomycetota bacterium]
MGPALVLPILAALPLSGTDWRQWGGPERSFAADAPPLADAWADFGADSSARGGPRELWSRPLGSGHSALVVAGNRAFTMFGDGERETVVALDARNGETLWSFAYTVRYATRSSAYGGPHATPLVDDEGRVITVGIDAKAHAFDGATGELLWSRDLVVTHGVDLPQSGYAASPVAWGETIVFAGTGGPGPSAIALRRDDGSTAWARHSFLGSHASPRVIEHGGAEHLVLHGTNLLVGLDPATGDLRWRGRVRTDAIDNVSFSPAWDPDTAQLFVSHAYDGKGVQAWRLTGNERQGWALDRTWTNRRLKVQHGNGVLLDGALHAADGESFLVGVDVASGETRYKRRGVPKSTLLAADGKLIALDGDGTLRLVAPGGEELARAKVLGSEAWTAPTLVGRTLYLRDGERAIALELP